MQFSWYHNPHATSLTIFRNRGHTDFLGPHITHYMPIYHILDPTINMHIKMPIMHLFFHILLQCTSTWSNFPNMIIIQTYSKIPEIRVCHSRFNKEQISCWTFFPIHLISCSKSSNNAIYHFWLSKNSKPVAIFTVHQLWKAITFNLLNQIAWNQCHFSALEIYYNFHNYHFPKWVHLLAEISHKT